MIEISVNGLVKEFEIGSPVLNGLTFQIDTGERVGLLGRNGSGKTTLLRILTGEVSPDGGEVILAPGRRLGLISQIPVYPDGYTVEDVLDTAFSALWDMQREMEDLTDAMARGEKAALRRYDVLSAALESGGVYEIDTRKNKTCAGLGISPAMRRQQFKMLSGGEATRINLARLILEDTDVLLLDEPTNHLDLHAVEWLEKYLAKFRGTVLAISHDRYFLDQVVNRVIEIDNGKAEFYAGNYTFYAIEKERRYEEKLKQYEKEQSKVKQLQEAADKLHLWAFMGNDKLHKRAFSMEKRIARLQKTDRPMKARALTASFEQREFYGDEILTARSLAKSYAEKTLFRDLDLKIIGGERIALIGDNGTGKTTLLKLLTGEERPDAGRLRLGPTVKIGYLPQSVVFDHSERTLVDTMIWEQDCTAQSARNRLAAFNFQGEDVFKKVSVLSGGERSRLKLCMLMDDKINFLILDEPTNHLDIASREWIEGAVERYDGALLFVSHDRYFIDRFATRIWELADGAISDYSGTYQEYLQVKSRQSQSAQEQPAAPELKREQPRRAGGTKNLEKEVAAAERAVGKAEERMFELTEQIDEAASDYLKLQELYEKRDALEEEILKLYGVWEHLSAELEAARE